MLNENDLRLQGYLGRDPELNFTQSGNPVTNLNLATDRFYKDRNGERQKRTTWHRVVVWGELAETCVARLQKGSGVSIKAYLVSRTIEKDGAPTEYRYEPTASRVDFITNLRPMPEPAPQADQGEAPVGAV